MYIISSHIQQLMIVSLCREDTRVTELCKRSNGKNVFTLEPVSKSETGFVIIQFWVDKGVLFCIWPQYRFPYWEK